MVPHVGYQESVRARHMSLQLFTLVCTCMTPLWLLFISPASAIDRTAGLLKPSGAWFGATVDWSAWDGNITKYTDQLGIEPASFAVTIELPLRDNDTVLLDLILPQVGPSKCLVSLCKFIPACSHSAALPADSST